MCTLLRSEIMCQVNHVITIIFSSSTNKKVLLRFEVYTTREHLLQLSTLFQEQSNSFEQSQRKAYTSKH